MSYQHQYIDGTPIHFPLGKVVCVGRNYAEHAAELNNPIPTEPLLFIKPGSCTVPMDDGFVIPQERGAVHFEAEIAVLIGKPLSNTCCGARGESASVVDSGPPDKMMPLAPNAAISVGS